MGSSATQGSETTAIPASRFETARCADSRPAWSCSRCATTTWSSLSSSQNQFFGFVIAGSTRTVIRDSSGNDNPAPDGDGLGVFGSHDLRIVRNSFRHNGQLGMHIEDSTKNLIKGNVVSRNGDFGIFLEADGNQVRDNRSVRDGGPASWSAQAAETSSPPTAFSVAARGSPSRRGAATWSRATWSLACAIPASAWESESPQLAAPARSSAEIWSGRAAATASSSRRADRRALLQGNIARGSGDDGFDVESLSATLRGNRALGSADLAVEGP